MRNLIQLDMVW